MALLFICTNLRIVPTYTAKSDARKQFFELLFADDDGWLCLATTEPEAPKATFQQKFFEWPNDINKIENYILRYEKVKNIYFSVSLLTHQQRIKKNCMASSFLWADLDDVVPSSITKIPPGIVVRSSPGRYQAYWRLSAHLPPFQAEDYSKRIAYFTDADKSGWDLGQLMRVPFTKNFKYQGDPMVMLEKALETQAPPLIFEALPIITGDGGTVINMVEMPELEGLPQANNVIYKYSIQLKNTQFATVYSTEPSPEEDWSKIVWKLINICLEAGMEAEEVLSVVWTAPCNKYTRDGRPIEHLWRDVLKAKEAQEKIGFNLGDYAPLTMPQLVNEPASETFIDQYRDWAEEATDAIVEFHDLNAFILLSAIVSNSVRLPTSNNPIVPNLWGLVLGDSTLSRKTTSTRMAMDLLQGMDPNIIVGTEGTAEGLLTALADRPNKASIFYKDEISGFFGSINRKDYLAGLPETLTALYDVPSVFSRRLRKEHIRIESPAFVFLGAGVTDRVYESINEEYVVSGFLPRFLVVSGDTEFKKLRTLGRPTEISTKKRVGIQSRLADLYEQYAMDVIITIGGQKAKMPPRIIADLTDEAWDKYGNIEMGMLEAANNSALKDMALPTFDRLSRSILKMAICLAAERQIPTPIENTITVTVDDITNAAWYAQGWGKFSIELFVNAGKRPQEKLLEKVFTAIAKNPGILRSQLTRHYKLSKREADEILATLEDRMLVRKEQQGRGHRYYPT